MDVTHARMDTDGSFFFFLIQFIPFFQNFVQLQDYKETVRLWNNWEHINTEESTLKES